MVGNSAVTSGVNAAHWKSIHLEKHDEGQIWVFCRVLIMLGLSVPGSE